MRQKMNMGILLGVLLIASMIWAQPIQIVLDGQTLKTEIAPIQEKGVTLVPLRVISEGLGAKVHYEPETKEIQIAQGEQEIRLTIGNLQVLINGEKKFLEVSPRIVEGITLVPKRRAFIETFNPR